MSTTPAKENGSQLHFKSRKLERLCKSNHYAKEGQSKLHVCKSYKIFM